MLRGISFAAAFIIFLGRFIVSTSADEVPWEYLNLYEICFGAPGFVAAGYPGLIYFSPDGDSWARVHKEKNVDISSVAYGNGRFVAVGSETITNIFNGSIFSTWVGRSVIFDSEDGFHWRKQPSLSTNGLGNVVYGNAGFIAWEWNGMWRSADGVHWAKNETPFQTGSVRSAVAGGGKYYAATKRLYYSDLVYPREVTIWESSDGMAWRSFTPEWQSENASLVFENGTLYASYPTRSTTNGIVWMPIAVQQDTYAWRSGWSLANGLQVQLNIDGSKASRDGEKWYPTQPKGMPVSLPVYGKGKWVAFLGYGVLGSSVDGIYWRPRLKISDYRQISTNSFPSFREQPASQDALIGRGALLQAEATGGGELRFQWFHGVESIAEATNDYLFFPAVRGTESGNYRVVAANDHGATTSSWATLTARAPAPPQILKGPENISIQTGGSAELNVVASGTDLTYLWFHDGMEIPYIRGPVLPLPDASRVDAGSYEVLVTNNLGTVRSAPAMVKPRSRVFTSDWEPLLTKERKSDWRGAAYGNGRFVLAGGDGDVLISTNGSEWVEGKMGSSGAPMRLDFDGARFLAVTAGGEVLESVDGLGWNAVFRVDFPLNTIAAAPDRAVAGGPGGMLAVMENGAWRTGNIGGVEHVNEIRRFDNWFIAACNHGILAASTNGMDWSRLVVKGETSWRALGRSSTNILAFGTSEGVIAGARGAVEPWRVVEAPVLINIFVTWTSEFEKTLGFARDLLYWRGKLAIFGGESGGIGQGLIALGSAWKPLELPFGEAIRCVAANEEKAVAAGEGGTVIVSTNLVSWESARTAKAPENVEKLAFDGDRFIVLARNGVFTSTDGNAWELAGAAYPAPVYNFTSHNGLSIITSLYNNNYYTTNLQTWTPFPKTVKVWDIVVSRNLYLGVAGSGIATSTNGYSGWKLRIYTRSIDNVRPYATDDGMYWAAGDNGALIRSLNGTNWTRVSVSTNWNFTSFCYGNGTYLATVSVQVEESIPGFHSMLVSSRDGVTWTEEPRVGSGEPARVSWCAGLFFLQSGNGLHCSTDGRHWAVEENFGVVLTDIVSDGAVLLARNDTYQSTSVLFRARKSSNPSPLIELRIVPGAEGARVRVSGPDGALVALEEAVDPRGTWTKNREIELGNGSAELTLEESEGARFFRAVFER